MNSNNHRDADARPAQRAAASQAEGLPAWTNGLRQLYDKVVDEDLPDSFKDLLARLDESGK